MCGRAETIRISYVWLRLKGIVQMTFWWPRIPADKRNIFSNKTTRHSWVLKTCYYSEEGQKTDGNINSILKINFLRYMDRIKWNPFSTFAIHGFLYITHSSEILYNVTIWHYNIESGKKKCLLSIIIKNAFMLRKLPAVRNWMAEDS